MKLPSLTASLVLLIGFASADLNLAVAAPVTDKDGTVLKGKFVLKNGKVLEGEVVRILGDAYVIEYQVNPDKPGIRDTKTVPKAEVVRIITEKLDEKAFVDLAKLTPTPDLLTADDYKERLQKVKTFITKFPKSPRVKEADAIGKELAKESAEVEAGGRKLQGLMIKGVDYRANAYELDARVIEAKIRSAAKNSQWLLALRAFADLDKDFQAAACYNEVKPVVVKALQGYRTQVAASLATFDARMEKQTADLEKMTPTDRTNSTRELAAQTAELEAKYQLEKSSGQPWVTPHANHKQSMEDAVSLAESELQRLSTASPATVDGGKAFRNAWKATHSDADAEAVEKALAEAEAAALPERYLKQLQEAAKASGKTPAEDK